MSFLVSLFNIKFSPAFCRYIVEKRGPPDMMWVKLESEVKEDQIEVTAFTRDQDFYFRVRAANEFGVSEPSMPAALRRKESKSTAVYISLIQQ